MASSIFDTAPPAWLTAIAKPIDSQLVGSVIGATLGAVGKEIAGLSGAQGYSRNFLTNLNNQFNDLRDPLWQVKAQQMGLQVDSAKVGLEDQKLALDSRREELASWAQAAPEVSAWLTKTPEARSTSAAPDTHGSVRAMQAVRQQEDSDWRYYAGQKAMEYAKWHTENQGIAAKQEIDDARSQLKDIESLVDRTERVRIRAITNPVMREAELSKALALQAETTKQATQDLTQDLEVASVTFDAKGNPRPVYKPKGAVEGTYKVIEERGHTFLIMGKQLRELYDNEQKGRAGILSKEINLLDKAIMAEKPDSDAAQALQLKRDEAQLEYRKLFHTKAKPVTAPPAAPSPGASAAPAASAGYTPTSHEEEADVAARTGVAPGRAPVKIDLNNQAEVQDAIDKANAMIRAGKDPAAVRQRLKDMGIPLKE